MTVLIVVETAVLIVLSVLVAGLLRSYATVLHGCTSSTAAAGARSTPPFRTADGVVAAGRAGTGRPAADRGSGGMGRGA